MVLAPQRRQHRCRTVAGPRDLARAANAVRRRVGSGADCRLATAPLAPRRTYPPFRHRGGAGNRFADPRGQYHETYGSTCLVGSLLELWANDVPDEATVIAAERVRRIAWDAPRELGVLPADRGDDYDAVRLWLPNGGYADVGSIRTRTWLMRQSSLRSAFGHARAIGPRLDSGLLEESGPRSRLLTQQIRRLLYEYAPAFAGIRFRTRLGDRHENWAVFYRRPIGIIERAPLRSFGPAILEALQHLGLRR